VTQIKTLTLVKGEQVYCFRYEVGCESAVLDALTELVTKSNREFDCFDVAILSHQLGQHLAQELRSYLPKKVA